MHEAMWNQENMMRIIDEHESEFFERPSRTQATNAPRGSGRERHFSSMLWRQRRPERSEQIRAVHLSSILRLRGTLERPFRASCGAGPGSSGHFASQLRLWARLEWPFRASCGSGPGSSSHFEQFVAPGQAQRRKRRQVPCFRARPSRVRPKL